MKILYIDAGDDLISTKNNLSSLHTAGHDVTMVNLQQEAFLYRDARIIDSSEALKPEENQYDQIIIAAHGHRGDIENCYSQVGETKIEKKGIKLLDAKNFAQFINHHLLEWGIVPKDIVFLVCYGARTDSFENYQKEPLSSFAYKFFHELCLSGNNKDIHMTAAIGEIRIGDQGKIEVTPEEALEYMDKLDSLNLRLHKLRSESVKILKELFPEDEFDLNLSKKRANFYDEIEYMVEEGEKPASDDVAACSLYEIIEQINQTVKEISYLANHEPINALENYGTISYDFNSSDSTCHIYLETEDKKSLYNGQLKNPGAYPSESQRCVIL